MLVLSVMSTLLTHYFSSFNQISIYVMTCSWRRETVVSLIIYHAFVCYIPCLGCTARRTKRLNRKKPQETCLQVLTNNFISPTPTKKKQQTKEEIRWIAFRLASTQLNCLLKCYCNSTAVGEVAPQVGLFLYCASCAAHPVLVAVTPCWWVASRDLLYKWENQSPGCPLTAQSAASSCVWASVSAKSQPPIPNVFRLCKEWRWTPWLVSNSTEAEQWGSIASHPLWC